MSPSIGPASIHFCYSSWRHFPQLLRLERLPEENIRRHYHINRATGTRRTGNLSSSSSMEARSNRTSDTFGVTSEEQWQTVRVGIFDEYDEWSIKTSRRGAAALRHTIKLTIETSLDTIMKGSTTKCVDQFLFNRNWSTLSPAMETTHILYTMQMRWGGNNRHVNMVAT